jgi:single-strand DNA-binding protein
MAVASVNKVILIGNLGRDPEIRYTPSGAAVATFSIATNEVRNNKEGQREERTEWHRIVAFGKLAEICGQYLSKGKQVYLEGKLKTRNWEDRDGKKRTTTEIIASNIIMLGRSGEMPAGELAPPTSESSDSLPINESDSCEDDIPF